MGRTFEGLPSWNTPAGRKAALGQWVEKIAKEVAVNYVTKTERDAAIDFVLGHRLSIANCFHRKLVRKDVVAELLLLFEPSKIDPSPSNQP
jgi:hypothetical protein